MIMIVRPEDLSAADRSALRALFRDLVLLARLDHTHRAGVSAAAGCPRRITLTPHYSR
ncbi:MAG: hypothetical protein JO057_20335 [Chloroflexi bacterium]|nr:hypothetical protein [Chloroflexota bacterium]